MKRGYKCFVARALSLWERVREGLADDQTTTLFPGTSPKGRRETDRTLRVIHGRDARSTLGYGGDSNLGLPDLIFR